AALAVWPDGHAMVVRCQSGALDTYLRLRQPVSDAVDLSFDTDALDHEAAPPRGGGQTVFARQPGRLAQGGVVGVASPDAPAIAQLALPADGAAVEAILEACGQPLTYARDDIPRIENVD